MDQRKHGYVVSIYNPSDKSLIYILKTIMDQELGPGNHLL